MKLSTYLIRSVPPRATDFPSLMSISAIFSPFESFISIVKSILKRGVSSGPITVIAVSHCATFDPH